VAKRSDIPGELIGSGRLGGIGEGSGIARQASEAEQPCKIALVVRLLAFAVVAAPAVKRLLRRLSPGSRHFMHKKPLQCYTLST
jgi:hypothetical protein